MAWLRVDDGFTEHRKLLGLKRSDRWTWMEVLTYCARQNNGGHVPSQITGMLRFVTPKFLKSCVSVGLLDELPDGQLRVHDWEHYNPKDPSHAARQARYRGRKRDGNRDAESDALGDAESDAPRAGTRARPVPSPEEPRSLKRAGGSSTGAQASKDAAPVEPRMPNPNKRCDECGATLGEGHHSDCPVLILARQKALA